MPPRDRRIAKRQIPIESEAQNEVVERSIPVRSRARHVDDEVDMLATRVDEMELIMTRFLRMNPQKFNDYESSSDAESWLQHITGCLIECDIEEGLQNHRSRVRPQAAQGTCPTFKGHRLPNSLSHPNSPSSHPNNLDITGSRLVANNLRRSQVPVLPVQVVRATVVVGPISVVNVEVSTFRRSV
ncbi:hypothetical protein F511_09471 [Dorcoceras hygrometricum]|uniref:Uncharacterized protein n=1 Tax=Dorcoceras hygrometricum TaxID=472368 RepID=A0A2Z7BNR9_9LAMI|nr:hypothetical protein F511_09471 [Dorcoceras hygrometricum]